jgi:SH3 domain-containing YSC84-like protein 1
MHQLKRKSSGVMGRVVWVGLAIGWAVAAALVPAARADNLQKVVDNSLTIFRKFQGDGDNPAIPSRVLAQAYAIAILDTTKGGFLFTGSVGTGVICARTADGWSGPYGLSSAGSSFGLSIGGEDIRLVLLVMSPEALGKIVANDKINFKGMFEAAAGPSAVAVRDNFLPDKEIYAYKVTDGVFAGTGFKGGLITVEKEETAQYYKQPVSIQQVLSGQIPAPAGATDLLALLSLYPPAPGLPGGAPAPAAAPASSPVPSPTPAATPPAASGEGM